MLNNMPMTTEQNESPGTTILSPLRVLMLCILLLSWFCQPSPAMAAWPHMTRSSDGTPISYEVYGSGEPTLVFVHGWSCDGRYWRAQIPFFAERYRVIVMDLAGHGHSGSSRTRYTMSGFGQDVRAVINAAGVKQVILIGHSMGGSVIAEAARIMPERVVGLIGVDTLENIEYPMTKEALEQMLTPLQTDFSSGCREFVETMIGPSCPPLLRQWILADMAAAPPNVAISALREMMDQYITGEAAQIFDQIKAPVATVNSDLWPINYAANRRHMHSFTAIVVEHSDHFLMLNRPDDVNPALQQAIDLVTGP